MGGSSYSQGYRYCSNCREYWKTESLRCPECGTPLRRAPRNKKKTTEKTIDPEQYGIEAYTA